MSDTSMGRRTRVTGQLYDQGLRDGIAAGAKDRQRLENELTEYKRMLDDALDTIKRWQERS
jgi:hypothetical protein